MCTLETLPLLRVVPLKRNVYHVQGIAVEGDSLWVTSVDSQNQKGFLHLFRLSTGEFLREAEVQEGARFHPGGIALEDRWIWVPVAENRPASTATVQKRDKRTLRLATSFQVNDHIGCVAATKEKLWGGNWDSRQIYLWDHAGKLLARKDNPIATRYQDMKSVKGELVASGVLSASQGAIDWLDPDSLQLRCRILAGLTDRGIRYTNEGMAIRGGELFLLPEDGASRLFVFSLRPSK